MKKFFSVFLLATSLPLFSSQLDNKVYIEYLKLKKETLEDNIRNIETTNFIPSDVLWFGQHKYEKVARPNPLKKVYNPYHPKSDKWGMIYLPNLDTKQEYERLKETKQQLYNLDHSS